LLKIFLKTLTTGFVGLEFGGQPEFSLLNQIAGFCPDPLYIMILPTVDITFNELISFPIIP